MALHLKQKKEQIVVKGKLEAAFTYLLNQGKYLRVFLKMEMFRWIIMPQNVRSAASALEKKLTGH